MDKINMDTYDYDCLLNYLITNKLIIVEKFKEDLKKVEVEIEDECGNKKLKSFDGLTDSMRSQYSLPKLSTLKKKNIPNILKEKTKQKPFNNKSVVEYLISFITNHGDYQRYSDNYKNNLKHNLPDRKFNFVGRISELDELKKGLLKCRKVSITGSKYLVSLIGMGGQGKSALCYEYAKKYEEEYGCICWLDLSEGNGLYELERFAIKECNIEQYSVRNLGDFEQKIDYYWEMLRGRFRKKCLFILDNIPSKSRVEPSILRSELANHHDIIMTSRKPIMTSSAHSIKLESMNNKDAVALFLSRSGIKKLDPESSELRELVTTTLGGHALSIALIGSYAKEQEESNISTLIAKINTYGADKALGSQVTEGYNFSLYAALDISFNSLSKQSKLLLLILTLFPRIPIAIDTLKGCIILVESNSEILLQLINSFTKKSGPITPIGQLTRHCLLEGKRNGIGMHEVVYDFAQHQWSKLWTTDPTINLPETEVSFIQASIKHLRSIIDTSENETTIVKDIKTTDLKILSGLLMPTVDIERNITPSKNRLDICLKFWFNNYRFHQFVYDSEIQNFLLKQMTNLQNYLKHEKLYNGMYKFILDKMIGHAYYADPKNTGKQAKTLFKEAIELGQKLGKKNTNYDFSKTIKWYEIFLIDHMINVSSKNRKKDVQTIPISNDSEFIKNLDLIESILPKSLLDLNVPVEPEDYSLLLRAAHYWGHRGNQDQYTLYKKILIINNFDSTIPILAEQARDHYKKAINYRFVALKIFLPHLYEKDKNKIYSKLPFLEDWISELPIAEKSIYLENFTQYFQGVGDIAHQYRGVSFIDTIEFCYHLGMYKKQPTINELLISFNAAEKLWDHACYSDKKKARKVQRDEPPIKYILWMCSSRVLMKTLNNYLQNEGLPDLKTVKIDILKEISVMQNALKIDYDFVAKEQVTQTMDIWNVLDHKTNKTM